MDNETIWKELWERITCVYHDDCRYCVNFVNDTYMCRLSGHVIFDNWAPCLDFKCGIPFEYCCGDCDR